MVREGNGVLDGEIVDWDKRKKVERGDRGMVGVVFVEVDEV